MLAMILGILVCFGFADDEFREFKGHEGPTRVVRFTPDGKTLVSSSGWPEGDGTIRVWDVATGKEARCLKGHKGNVDGISLSKDGKLILSVGHDGSAKLWDLATGKLKLTFGGHEKTGVVAVAISPDGKVAATGDGKGKLLLWNMETGKTIYELNGHTKDVRCAMFTQDGKKLLSGSWDKTLRIWDVATGKEIKTIEVNAGAVDNMAMMANGNSIALACSEKCIFVDLETYKLGTTLPGAGGVVSVALSADGKRCLTGDYNGEMKLWDVVKGTMLAKYVAHNGAVYWVDFAPDGKTAATAGGGHWVNGKATKGEDFVVRVWKLEE